MTYTSGLGGYLRFNGNANLGSGSGNYIYLYPGGTSTAGLKFSGAPNDPSNVTLSFLNLRNDGPKKGIINSIDVDGTVYGGILPIDLYMYPGKDVYTNNQANIILAFDGTNLRGNVGVGTASPTAQLHTTGTVRFAGLTADTTKTRVLVSDANGNLYYRDASTLASTDAIRTSLAVNWPDYVFAAGYRLPGLAEVEAYIRKEHHLSEVPSADEVRRKGIDGGAVQATFLKKIEELTLYTIQQDKQLAAQRTEIADLKARLEKLEQLITKKEN
jgi:hypothetical protein